VAIISSTSEQQQAAINQLIVLREDLADIEADLQAAPTELARQQLRQEAETIRREIEALEAQLSASADQPPTTTPPLRTTRRTGQGFIEPLLTVTEGLPLHMVQIPGGTFLMGSPADEPDREEDEGPQHEVTVPTFFMGRYPITQAQYEAVMGTNPATEYDPECFVAPNKPVVGVSWHDAVAFCTALAQRTGRPYRLPSEAEWEYACRAGTTTPFYFGSTITTEVANYNGQCYTYGDGPEGEFRNALTPVDHFGIANRFGLSDMHGNVWEWCQDNVALATITEPPPMAVPGLGDSSSHVLRGGSWTAIRGIAALRIASAPLPTTATTSTSVFALCVHLPGLS
jgi:formylglycine-generating enzyme required for sulfatase activity